MFCGNCGAQMKEEQQFCSACGTKLEKVEKTEKVEKVVVQAPKQFCGNCGKEIEKDEKFCGSCGAKKEEQVSDAKPNNKEEAKNPEQPKKKLKKKSKFLLILLILIIIAVGVGYYYMYTMYKPDEVAKRFCSTMEEQDYEKMFSTLSFPESEYIDKDIFAKHMKTTDLEEISEVEYKFIEDGSSSSKRIYEITVTIDGDEETEEITLVKSDNKKYFLFDDWRIEMESIVVDEWEVSVPTGSTLYIDNKEVKSEKVTEENEDIYVVQNLLATEYEVKVTHPLAEEVNKSISTYTSANIELTAKKDIETELKDHFGNFAKEFYISILQTNNMVSSTGSSTGTVAETKPTTSAIYDQISEIYGEDINKLRESGMTDVEIQKYLDEKYSNIYSVLSKGNEAEPVEEGAASNVAPSGGTSETASGIRQYIKDDQSFTEINNQGKIIKEDIINSLSYYYQDIDIKNVSVTNFTTKEMSITGQDTIKLETSCTLSFDYLFKDSYNNSTYRHHTGIEELELTIIKVDNTWLIINIK